MLLWTLERGLTATAYNVSYLINNDTDCFNDSSAAFNAAVSQTMYTVTGLEEGTQYSVTITAILTGGETVNDSDITSTQTAGTDYRCHNMLFFIANPYYAAPSAPPTFVTVSVENSTSVTIEWGPVDCRHQNGEITGYAVMYGEEGSSEGDKSVQMVSGDSSGGMVLISGLTKETIYTFELAAHTSVSIGVYSHPMTITTPNGESLFCVIFSDIHC